MGLSQWGQLGNMGYEWKEIQKIGNENGSTEYSVKLCKRRFWLWIREYLVCITETVLIAFTQEASPIDSDTPLHLAPVNMSSSFDELEEDEQDELERRGDRHSVSPSHLAHCSTRMLPCEATTSAAFTATSAPAGAGTGFLPSLTKKTTSRLCHWMSSNWANRSSSNFSSINVRECLPPMYHNTKNIVKTIKVRLLYFPMSWLARCS